jgi:hypothetical protein
MNVIRSSPDCVDRIEFLKAVKQKDITAARRREQEAETTPRTQEPQRQRSAQGVLFG